MDVLDRAASLGLLSEVEVDQITDRLAAGALHEQVAAEAWAGAARLASAAEASFAQCRSDAAAQIVQRVLGAQQEGVPSRVLSSLVDNGYVLQQQGSDDRRQRLLYLTETGTALEARLTAVQGKRFAAAYREAGVSAVEGFQKVLQGLLDAETRSQAGSAPKGGGAAAPSPTNPAKKAAS